MTATAPMYQVERRWSRVLPAIYYLCFVATGVSGMVAPSRAVRYGVPPWGIYIWASFYVLGALACLGGLIFKTRGGEIVGLPLISSASALYGFVLLIQYFSIHDGAYLAVSALVIGQAVILFDRWIYAMRLFRTVQGAAADGR